MSTAAVPVCYCLHDDHWFLDCSIRSWQSSGPVYALVSRLAWNGEPGNWERCVEVAKQAGAEVIIGDWPDEDVHRRAAHEHMKAMGHSFVFTPDGDEVVEPALLETLVTLAECKVADRVHVYMDTYWKSPDYIIRPRENLAPIILVNLQQTTHEHIREFSGGRRLILDPEFGVLHHLSYAGPNERIQKKIRSWGHRHEVVRGWYERVWLQWDSDKLLRNLHPTHPQAYGFAERIHVPEILKSIASEAEKTNSSEHINVDGKWPTISVVIPLHGGEEDIKQCLDSLDICQDLLHQVIVIDNASPDKAAKIAKSYKFVQIIKNKANDGFAKASNQGLMASTGEVVLFLNSDTIVPRIALIRLIETLESSGSVGAVGPLTNACGHSQQIEPTYTSLDTLDLFAEDFANRDVDDADAPADMLVGFCLVVKHSALKEVGGFDEGFGLGTFEDNDLCYRIRRAGYRLLISSRSFVHHHGSKTLRRISRTPWNLLATNDRVFRAKWQEDLESGFASHLPGMQNGLIVFDISKHPKRRLADAKKRAKIADISLCMIVKNEERVLADCLKSAQPFFNQMIVVDTGSTDRTKEIAKEFGAEVYDYPWTDSFSAARNESLKFAKGKWIFWMDADDTLPFKCGEEVHNAVLNASDDTVAFVVPVQFVQDGPGAGTRVDHVKLFRADPRVSFEGRIHEQNLPSIRALGGQIHRSNILVMHSGYDMTPEGQARKRQRDEKLLKMDHEERPDHPFPLFNLGMTAHFLGEHKEAIGWLQQCLKHSQPGESHIRKTYALLASSQASLGLTGEALSTTLKGLAEVGEDPELRYSAGTLLAEMNRLPEAKQQFEAIQQDIGDHFSSIDMSILTFRRCNKLGSICMLMNDYAGAKSWWLKALEYSPTFMPSVTDLFDAAVDLGDYPTAKWVIEHFREAAGPGEEWARLGTTYFEAIAGPEEAEHFLRKAVFQNPYSVGPRLLLSRRLLQSGRDIEALEHLDMLEKLNCAEGAFFLGVSATRRGDIKNAFYWMQRAHELNPNHEDTKHQMDGLRQALQAVGENV